LDVLVNLGFQLPVLVLDDFRILEVLLELFLALDPAVLDFADLLRLVVLPSLAISLVEEVDDEDRMNEVNERVTDVAVVGVVDGQVEEIEPAFVVLLNLLGQHLHVVLVRDVLDHASRAGILAAPDLE